MTQIVVRLPYEEKAQFMKIATKNDMRDRQYHQGKAYAAYHPRQHHG